jgi:hypothetical protein
VQLTARPVATFERDYLRADETPVRCNDPEEKRGGTTQGYLWVISRPGADVVFEWRLSRRHWELTSLLYGFKGVLQSDGYSRIRAMCVRKASWGLAAGRIHGVTPSRQSDKNGKHW